MRNLDLIFMLSSNRNIEREALVENMFLINLIVLNMEKRGFELFYSNGGHGGPYDTLADAIDAATRMVRYSTTPISIEIRHRGSEGWMGRTTPVGTITISYANGIIVAVKHDG